VARRVPADGGLGVWTRIDRRARDARALTPVLKAMADRRGRFRAALDDPQDWVRLEIEAAIQRRVRIIPVLIDCRRKLNTDPGAASEF
jgi:hypothetical protein